MKRDTGLAGAPPCETRYLRSGNKTGYDGEGNDEGGESQDSLRRCRNRRATTIAHPGSVNAGVLEQEAHRWTNDNDEPCAVLSVAALCVSETLTIMLHDSHEDRCTCGS